MTAPAESLDDAIPEPPAPEGAGFFGETDARPAAPAPAAAPYRVLARAYRPAGFDDMIGQDATVRILRRAFATGRVAHAFMLTGVRGVGKTTTARIIARALTCVGPDGTGGPTADPCGVCPNCVAIGADRHPDVLELDAASRTGVDDVREIIEATRFRPMQARCKVFIVDEVHMLSRNAFNALLKTLEEPPDHVTFVFATTELRKVPVTVLSRCQRFDLRRVGQDVLAAHFGRIAEREGVAAEADAIGMIARAADGSVRDGLSLLDQAIATAPPAPPGEKPRIGAEAVASMLGLADRSRVFDLLEALLAGRAGDVLPVAAELADRGADPAQVLGDLLDLVHVLTRLRTIPSLLTGSELPELERVRGGALALTVGVPALGRAWQMLLKGIGEIESAPDRQAAAEMVLIRLCHLAAGPTPAELLRRVERGAPDGPVSGAAAADGPPADPSVPSGGAGRGRPERADRSDRPPVSEGALARALDPPSPVANASPSPAIRPTLRSWREIVAAIGATGRDPILLAQLRHAVRPVRVLPGIVEIRPDASAPRDLAARLSRLLGEISGERWTVAFSTAPGDPTLAERAEARRDAEHEAALRDPLVASMLRVFPGAVVSVGREDADDDELSDDAGEAVTGLGGTAEAAADAELAEARREDDDG